MKKLTFFLILICPFVLRAQFGLKAGLNFTNVTKASSITTHNSSGFNLGVFYATSNKKILSSKTELVFSRQGFSYQTNNLTDKVNLDYIMLPQYMCINITHFFQIQVGFQLAYLLSAKSDSTASNPLTGTPYGNAMDYYNRFNYGIGGGVEVHPFKGSLIGARINLSLNDLYKIPDENSTGTQSSYSPALNAKTNLFQIYIGWAFGQ